MCIKLDWVKVPILNVTMYILILRSLYLFQFNLHRQEKRYDILIYVDSKFLLIVFFHLISYIPESFCCSLWILGMKFRICVIHTAAMQIQKLWEKKLRCILDITKQFLPQACIRVELCVET